MEWDKIFFSLDSPSAATHNGIRGADCFGKVTRNMKTFSAAKIRRKTSKPILCIHMVVCNRNYNQIADMVRLASELGVQEVVINALNVWKKEMAALALSGPQEAEMRDILQDAVRIADKLRVRNNFIEFLQSDLLKKANEMDDAMKGCRVGTHKDGFKNAPCYYPWYNISIFSDGTVQPCFIPQGVGERIREKGLKDIWDGPVFDSARKECLEGRLSWYCARCNPWNLSKMEEIRNRLRGIA
jgi:MoaA/NifB/PqqE/SkfB family radical SAM enzyme